MKCNNNKFVKVHFCSFSELPIGTCVQRWRIGQNFWGHFCISICKSFVYGRSEREREREREREIKYLLLRCIIYFMLNHFFSMFSRISRKKSKAGRKLRNPK